MLKWARRPAGAVRCLLIFANPPYKDGWPLHQRTAKHHHCHQPSLLTTLLSQTLRPLEAIKHHHHHYHHHTWLVHRWYTFLCIALLTRRGGNWSGDKGLARQVNMLFTTSLAISSSPSLPASSLSSPSSPSSIPDDFQLWYTTAFFQTPKSTPKCA